MRQLTRAVGLIAMLACCAAPSLANAGERDALIVREVRLRAASRGDCTMELLLSPDPSFRASAHEVSITLGGVVLLGGDLIRTPKGTYGVYATRWRFRNRVRTPQVIADFDLRRGVVFLRAHKVDLAALSEQGAAAVPITLRLGASSLTTTVTFREVGSSWRFVSQRDAVPNTSDHPPFRVLGDGSGYIEGRPIVARTQGEYRRLMASAGYAASAVPAVDFAQEVVVATSLGRGLSACLLPSVHVAEVSRFADDVYVLLSGVRPSGFVCTNAQNFYDVAAFVAVPRLPGDVDIDVVIR